MIWILVLLAGVSFVQNAAFTAVSRSRNSGDVVHHAKWAVASNGLWFINQVLIVSALWSSINSADWLFVSAAGIVYVISTSLGSVLMMRRMLATESGKRRVGARS